MPSSKSDSPIQRKSVPFKLTTADGEVRPLSYSSPRRAATHDEHAVLNSLPWF